MMCPKEKTENKRKGGKNVYGMEPAELKSLFVSWGKPAYRGDQVFRWLYQKKAASFEEMTDIPGELAGKLNETLGIQSLVCLKKLRSGDGARKFLFGLEDGRRIETVFIPEAGRRTVCVSTQVGCKIGCPFCVSGSGGFIRQLTTHEIVTQVLEAARLTGEEISNIVFMGIGEPLDNTVHVLRAVRILNHPLGMKIGARRITISTCGLIPGIETLRDFDLQVKLSVSLHAVKNDLRDRLVPVNRTYPLEKLMAALEDYDRTKGRLVTLEYALISGINDSDADASRLAGLAGKIKAKVNLIPCNPGMGDAFRAPSGNRTYSFKRILEDRKITVTRRNTKGRDILAACGQLVFDREPEAAESNGKEK
ncbi:MAG: 23S rRNA (adenine(2503)-C(2))-methyltransferase RlmN [Acidobacteria bacterium]|nr:23S rRNA (adenine(2503)-C(2))-methyltransferase RlmN [Acidobacteriota bacterium]MBU1339762.1 23S rRNA (adenine(2503)-C(2))-methyltransferase RlmN [Acidobacteriota bacterium]MBU1474879.1 23S rRNA (adenine(2503)-C(2))-methyltransferase RlmN [Acidobacteriota bacterium]MBU2439266.1 23S rRNA (adenine(2503)-C(2))-methyltransferase RlmN [Acidobacteriota bacterium]MBU4330914.1 23S rRNA (adenine(2503)-C(2))-methyltransferase RlmN [Acidobacteriota bacterium]